MKTFQRYLSSINKASIVDLEVSILDLPAADLDRLLAKLFKISADLMASDDYEPNTLSGLQQSSFPKTDLIPLSFRQMMTPEKYSSRHQQNPGSRYNTSEYEHLQGVSGSITDVNSRTVFPV